MTATIQHATLDAVLLWLTPTVERDYVARDIFHALRTSEAIKMQNDGRSLHVLTPAEASAVLADAQAQHGKVLPQRGLKVAYAKLIKNLKPAIGQSAWRLATMKAPGAVRVGGSDWHERWFGSRRQLEASGFMIDGALPGEGGSSSPRGRARDSHGYSAVAVLVSPLWLDFFEVTVLLPDEHRRKRAEVEQHAARIDAARLAGC